MEGVINNHPFFGLNFKIKVFLLVTICRKTESKVEIFLREQKIEYEGGKQMVIRNIQDQLIGKTPLAFSFHEAIFNEQGHPVDYKLLEINQSFEKKFNLKRSEVMGKYMTEWLLPTDEMRKKWLAPFAELMLTEGRLEFDEMLELNDRWYLLAAFVPYPGYLIVLFRDTTKLKKTELILAEKQLALKTSRALVQNYFDNSPGAIIIYEVKGDGATGMDYIIRDVNNACLQIEAWQKEAVLNQSLGTVRAGVEDFGIIGIFQQVWKTGKTISYPAKIYSHGEEYRWFENIVFKLPTGEIVAVYSDVTDKMLAQQKLVEEKEKLKVTLYSIGDGVIATDKWGKVEMINQVAEDLTGWKSDEARGKALSTIFEIYNEETGEVCENPVDLVLKTGRIVGLANHTVLRSKDGVVRAIADSAAPIKTHSGEILGVILVFRDVTEEKEKEERIKFLSYRDALTGLYNRAYFEEEIQKLNTERQLPLTIVMGDLDGLKLINDVFGHQKGDEALKRLSKVFKDACRSEDVIARWGGDEFVILLPKTSEEMGQKICCRIKDYCRGHIIEGTEISISLGCATKTKVEENWEEILKIAEENMYKNKLLGEKSYRSTVLASIKHTLFLKSCETEEHGQRLAGFCRKIGTTMGLPNSQLDELEVLAMLHDVGKIAIDNGILQKTSPLTKAEWSVMKKHPEIGYRIAQAVPDLLGIADYILAHHERWDGQGYPRGLAGEDIPLLARILAVADAYDAMTQNRPYRRALSADKAKAELRKNAGTQFDPQIVKIFLDFLEKTV